MELSFKFNENSNWKNGKFIINELKIINGEIEYDSLKLYLDNKEYEGGISTFTTNNVSADWLFENILNSYLRDDPDYQSFSDEWKIFKDMENKKEYQDDLLIKFPEYDYGKLKIFELQLATKNHLYYQTFEECKLLTRDYNIMTDMECFFTGALWEDLAEILLEKQKPLYINDGMKSYMNDYKKDILEEYKE